MEKTEILKMAITANGATHQEIIAIEECSELIQAITHKHEGENTISQRKSPMSKLCLNS